MHGAVTGSREQWEKVEKKGNDRLKEARVWYKFAETDEAKVAQIPEIHDFVVPDGQTEIAECAFAGYFHLTTVVIPASVTKIGKDAFVNCEWIIVHYRGTKKQWKKIKIEDGNTVLKKALILYEYRGTEQTAGKAAQGRGAYIASDEDNIVLYNHRDKGVWHKFVDSDDVTFKRYYAEKLRNGSFDTSVSTDTRDDWKRK